MCAYILLAAEPRPATPTDVLPPKPDPTDAPVKDEDKSIKVLHQTKSRKAWKFRS